MLSKTALLLKRFSTSTLLFYAKQNFKGISTEFKKNSRFFQEAYMLATIDLDSLEVVGIRGIILDLDNTIVSEDDRYTSPGAEAWIKQAKIQGFKFFILSNGKRRHRAKAWANRLEIPLINPARKPFPAAFRQALKFMQLQPKQVVVIGDSRHTDILGAWFVGCHSIQVATLPHPMRWWEKLLGKRVQTPYPLDCELWENNWHKNKNA